MGVFEDTVNKACEVITDTGKKGGEVIEVSKLKLKKSSVKSELRKDYEVLGMYYYCEKVKGEDNAEKIAEIIEKINSNREKYEALKLEIAKHTGKIICDCGAVNDEDSAYCNKCGKEF